MNAPAATVWQRTGAGNDELHRGRLGLNARLRQLLRLIDGRRDERELIRLMAMPTFDEQIRTLVDRGLIRAASEAAPAVGAAAMTNTANTVNAADTAYTAPAFHPAIIDRLAMARDVTMGDVTMREATTGGPAMHDPASVDPTLADALEQTRARMIVALNELVGEHGAPLTARLQRCTALRELRELLPATLAIVEAVGGPSATHDFLHRAGRI